MELSAPNRLQRFGAHKFYFYLRRENGKVYLQTKRFYSSGPFKGLNGKSCLYLPRDSGVLPELREIHSFCKAQVVCPSDAPKTWKLHKAWNELEEGGIFVTLSDAFQAFDREKKKVQTVGRGYYTLRLHLPGVYLGDVNGEPLARLQVKVLQAIFEPDEETSVCQIDI